MKIVFVLICFTTALVAQDCGVKRWSVKTLSDVDTSHINFSRTVPSSVHRQINLQRPIASPNSRLESEDTVYSIFCNIICFKKEKDDKDIHLVIEDPITHETMVAELISSQCSSVLHTSRYEQFKALEEWFTAQVHKPTSKFYYLPQPLPVHITGIGFYDFVHGQKGMASNGREIHPILSMEIINENHLHK
jgi:hypothetical protein